MNIGTIDIHDIDDETGRETERVIARTQPASLKAVIDALAAPENEDNGRSEWLWIRLANGDLILGFFPQGDTYFANEAERTV